MDKRYEKLQEFALQLLQKKSFEEGLPLIVDYIKEVIGSDRSSIFIYDSKKDVLWSTHAEGLNYIEVDADKGIVGWVFKTEETLFTNDAYSHPAFLEEVDKQTGYRTKNIIATPIFDSTNNVMGVLELINKEGGFDEEDKKFVKFFAHYISGFLELINVFEKDRVRG